MSAGARSHPGISVRVARSASIVLFFVGVLAACPQQDEQPEIQPSGIEHDEARYRPSDPYLAEREGRAARYQPGSLQVVAARLEPSVEARLSLVAYRTSKGDYCVDLVSERPGRPSGDRAGLCSSPPVRDSFNFSEGQLRVGDASLGCVIGVGPGSIVDLHGKRFDPRVQGRRSPGMFSAPLPQFDGLVAWAVVIKGWSASGGDVVRVVGFSGSGKRVLTQDVCACS